MSEYQRGAPTETASNVGDLVEDVLLQAKTLLQAELSLARREIALELGAARALMVWLTVGVLCIHAALVSLGVLLVLWLGAGYGALTVAVLAVAGVSCTGVALRRFQGRKLPRTTDRLRSDAQHILATLK